MKKTIKILVSLFVILGVSFGSYSYFIKNDNLFSRINKTESIPLNYSFNTKASFKIIEEGKENGFNLDIKNASIITQDNGLKQRVQLEKMDLNVISEDNFSIKNVDIISDNENVYLKGDFGKLTKELPEQLIKLLEKGKYSKIDNSKAILDILGDFKNNELINELVTGFVTSNPKAYFENNKTDEKLIKYLKSDNLINFIFKDGEYDEVTKKTSLLFNDRLCELSPIVNKITSEIYGFSAISDDKTECINQLKKANQFLAMVNIYKEGNSKDGNYKFVINQGKIIDISISYSNHNLDNWNISLSEPNSKIIFKANGNNNELLSSLLKIDIDESGVSIKGEIKNGKGEIKISSEEESMVDLSGFISFDKYFIDKYDLKGGSEFVQTSFTAKGNTDKGNINIESRGEKTVVSYEIDNGKLVFDLKSKDNKGEEIAKVDLKAEYPTLLTYITNLDEVKYDLDVFIKGEFELKSKFDFEEEYLLVDYNELRDNGEVSFKNYIELDYENKKIDLEIINYFHSSGKEDQNFKFSLNEGKVSGTINEHNKKKGIIDGTFEDIGNFNIKIDVIAKEGIIEVTGKTEDEIYKYNLYVTEKGQDFASGKAQIKFEDNKISSNGSFSVEKEKFEANYSFDHSYTNGNAKYELPVDFEEVDMKVGQIFTMPNFEEIGRYNKISGPKTAIVVITGGAIVGTVGFISLQGYTNDAKNTKVYYDLMTLATAVEVSVTRGDIILEDLISSNNKINFRALKQNGDDFKQPDGNDYLISIKKEGNIPVYQLLGYTINGNGSKTIVIRGNYVKNNDNLPDSLFKVNGKYLRNGDIIDNFDVIVPYNDLINNEEEIKNRKASIREKIIEMNRKKEIINK